MGSQIKLEFEHGCDLRHEFNETERQKFSEWVNRVQNDGIAPNDKSALKLSFDHDMKPVGGNTYQFRVSVKKRVLFRLDPGGICTLTHAGVHL